MQNFIIKFKESIKQDQIRRRKMIKRMESEILELDKVFSNFDYAKSEYLSKNIKFSSKLPLFTAFYMTSSTIFDESNFEKIYNDFLKTFKKYKGYYNYLQMSINAFNNEKMISPLNDLYFLLLQLNFSYLSDEEKSRIFGMAIYFDSQYFLKHKNNSIKDIDIICSLSKYYNEDGTFKYAEDVEEYSNLLDEFSERNKKFLFSNFIEIPSDQHQILKKFISLLKSNNEQLNQNPVSSTNSDSSISSVNIEYNKELMDELHKYYKNGDLVALPEDIYAFYDLLDKLDLPLQEKKYIYGLIEEKLTKIKNNPILKYLSEEERDIYLNSLDLFSSFKYTNADFYLLKQYIEELKAISSMLDEELSTEDIDYLLLDIPKIIYELKKILDIYRPQKTLTSNKLIFLTDKFGIPYISADINSLDNSYLKQVSKLLSKLPLLNKNKFKKVMSENLPYSLYSIQGSGLGLTFVELDSETYLIVGTDLLKNGYKKSSNRLKLNKNLVDSIMLSIKNPDKRDELLKFNEQYLDLFEPEKKEKIKVAF